VIDPQFTEYIAANAAPEHFRPGTKVSRFFCAALLDAASSEAGVQATLERCQDARIHLGRKMYAFLNYRWDNGAQVEDFINKSLCFGIFASNTKNFFTGVEYETNANGYRRDKKLLDWYVPLVRTLSHAGWEPVRNASIQGTDIAAERFGHGPTVYFTLYNNSARRQACTLTIDLAALGFGEAGVGISEIGRHSKLQRGAGGAVTLDLEAKKTYVIQVSGNETR
jgi:hypothetical protein